MNFIFHGKVAIGVLFGSIQSLGSGLGVDQLLASLGEPSTIANPTPETLPPPLAQPAKAPLPEALPPKPAPPIQGQKQISNVFVETDIKQALSDLATQAGVTIVPDETVTGTISATLKNLSLEDALAIVLAPGAYAWTNAGGFYVVGKAEPTSPNFFRFAVTRSYKPAYLSAERLATLLPTSLTNYVRSAPGELTLTITAAPAMADSITKILKSIDQPPTRVMLEALVTEVSADVLNQYGFSWVWKYFGLTGDIDSTEFKYTKASQADLATLKGLIGNGKAEVRANPRIMSVEGKEASVEVAQENYFQVITGPANFPYATLQTIKTGIMLKMTPIISEDGEVTVVLNPEVSDAVGSGPGGLPINTVRRANTTVRVKDGETIVIGGMTYASTRNRSNKVPLLGDLPLVGGLFRGQKNEVHKTEVIIMVTPRIIKP